MEIRLRSPRGMIALFKTSEASAEEKLRALPPARAVNRVRSSLAPYSGRASIPARLLDLAFSSGPGPGRPVPTRAVLDALSRQLTRRSLIVVEISEPVGYGIATPGTVAAPPPQEPAGTEELTWVEVVLLDEEGTPMAGQKCKLELPDGSTREVTLDDTGAFRVDDIPPGMCQVSFPEVPVNATAGG